VLPSDSLFDAKKDFWLRGENNDGSNAHHTPANFTAAVAAAVESARSQNIDPTIAIHSAMQAVVSAAADDARQGKKQSNENSNADVIKKRIRVCVSNNENTRVLFSMLRVLACNEEELLTISSSPTLPFGDSGCSGFLNRALRGFSGRNAESSISVHNVAMFRTSRDIRHPLGLRNEKAAMLHLLKVIKDHLDLYPCSLAQDIADLLDEESYPRFSNRRHAKIQIRGEKEVLHHFALWAQTAVDVIDIIEREIKIMNEEADESTLPQGFEDIIHAMEEGEGDGPTELHHTIVRYCGDVLGALRKEALKHTKKGKELPKEQIS